MMIVTVALLATGLEAQKVSSGQVNGSIHDAVDHTPLPGVSISFGKGNDAIANDSGWYAIILPAGTYKALFRFIGYADQVLPVSVPADGVVTLNIDMQAATSQLDMVVISASKFEQRVGEVTQSLSVLPAALIR